MRAFSSEFCFFGQQFSHKRKMFWEFFDSPKFSWEGSCRFLPLATTSLIMTRCYSGVMACVLQTVTGCPDVVPPADAWLFRSGDSLVVSCNFTLKRWHIVCNGRDWVGSFTNCTEPRRRQSGLSRLNTLNLATTSTLRIFECLNIWLLSMIILLLINMFAF